ncbi:MULTISPECIES: ribosome silencing factor [Sphingobacterium]|jgi:ribosome-associated protein|uniref:Ribosomal silencing factor RsfS n=2 Tax=Sphingobacterium TaxID=28453 RepID=A0ABW5Z0C1_9SPHI|nr:MULTISPECIES: ribosome silencing factor [Sphingobacterium]KKX49027.1 iojap family protein [Sphingobacterium sp. IITKGP-BTPF85]NJI75080.1 ribosome silencing factor [Sphingobacterium sp. B16(2022)]QQD15311.1 ribosome silencing factor [Sphingobacterium sp. UDSM-2020]TCR00833.1 ribosome-associated protein [Sphingobacterium sp. JUb20]TCR13290.1 ribosome-associated protein [Sphingobacterium sp. JUb78]
MDKNKSSELSTRLSEVVVYGMQEKKANEIVRLDLRNINSSVSDYFVICHADSHIQAQAIAKSVEDEVYKTFGQDPQYKEGQSLGEWLILDFVDVVVHIFKKEKRALYAIEDLWGDAQIQDFQSA